MVRLAAQRIGIDGDFRVGQIADVDELVRFCVEERIDVLFSDSIQTLHDGNLHGATLLKSVVKNLAQLSKSDDVTVFAVGHITKGGGFAGPQEIKHEVDAHAHLRCDAGNRGRAFVLEKNRFGPAGVPYTFSLSAKGIDLASIAVEASEPTTRHGRGAERKAKILSLIKDRLKTGEAISGYCFERLSVDCSGGLWRHLCRLARQELEAEGERLTEKTIDGRAYVILEHVSREHISSTKGV